MLSINTKVFYLMAVVIDHGNAMLQRNLAGKWEKLDAYTDHDADISKAIGKNAKNRYRRACRLALDRVFGGVPAAGDAAGQLESHKRIDLALPRSSTIKQCIAFLTVVDHVSRNLPAGDLYSPVADILTRVQVLRGINAPLYIARETSTAAYFVGPNPGHRTKSLILMRRTPDTVYDLLRSFPCDFTDVAAHVAYQLRINDYNAFPYAYIELEHLDDRYKVTMLRVVRDNHDNWQGLPRMVSAITAKLAGIANVNPNLDRSIDAVDLNLPAIAVPAGGAPVTAQFICFGYQHVPTISEVVPRAEVYDIAALFKGQVHVDREYEVYCNRQCEAPYGNDTVFMRDMQIQERVGALAGTAARRYSAISSIPIFVANMQTTSRRNDHPMDMAHTISTLAQLDVRRGPGTYSDYIRTPALSPPERKPMEQYMPLYPQTWAEFLEACGSLEDSLVPHGH